MIETKPACPICQSRQTKLIQDSGLVETRMCQNCRGIFLAKKRINDSLWMAAIEVAAAEAVAIQANKQQKPLAGGSRKQGNTYGD